jgi:hypothetical protein
MMSILGCFSLEECTLSSLVDDEDEGEEGSEGPPPPTPLSSLTEDSPSSTFRFIRCHLSW